MKGRIHMRLLVTTNARLYKTHDGKYWTHMVYGYDFFTRYLKVFDEVKLVAHVKYCGQEEIESMLRVDGPGVTIYDVPFPNGKIEYIKRYNQIRKSVSECFYDCDAAILRIPDQLAFQIYPYLKKNNIPVGVEVTSDSWEFFSPGSGRGVFRIPLRLLWHYNQKKICKEAWGTSYVTKSYLQERYPPTRAIKDDGYTTSYTNANIDNEFFTGARKYTNRMDLKIIHISGNIGNNSKGYRELIKAVGTLNAKGISIKLVFVGGGELNNEAVKLVDEYGISSLISCTGKLKKSDEIIKELKGADLFVFPSYTEGLPRVVIEAMATGLPCISTQIGGIKELLDEKCLVPVKEVKGLANKIEEFVTNPKLLEEQSIRNIEKAKEYSIDNIEKERTKFYFNIKKKAHHKSGGIK